MMAVIKRIVIILMTLVVVDGMDGWQGGMEMGIGMGIGNSGCWDEDGDDEEGKAGARHITTQGKMSS